MANKQKVDRYEMHKYWGKKPSSSLTMLIEKYTSPGDTVLDPFSGYGVFNCEAYLLGRNSIANDLNPIANFLNMQLVEQGVDLKLLTQQWAEIRNELVDYIDKWYGLTINGERVTLISILRDKLDRPLKAKFKKNNKVTSAEVIFNEDQINKFFKFESGYEITDWYPNNELIVNSRISAKPGMHINDLFTTRTLACHARLLALIEKYSSGKEQDLLKVAFTANLANCSKLVPPIKSRGDMSQGAWMTGFYTGPTYIENNVLTYFENRLKKVLKGKIDYLSQIENTDEVNFMALHCDAKKLPLENESIDFVFTDPPYGSAVPYFEQSILWNAWMKFKVDYNNEIVISDSKIRKEKNASQFEEDILIAFAEISRVLKKGKYFSFTYHSLSGTEWKAITNACILNGFTLYNYEWLTQKAFTPRQINRTTTVKGDVLVTCIKQNVNNPPVQLSDTELETFFTTIITEWIVDEKLDTNTIFLKVMKKIFTDKILIGDVNILNILRKNFTLSEDGVWGMK